MRLNKPYTNKEYADLAVYCNQNKLDIIDKGEYLESVNLPEPTIEEKEENIRAVRDRYLVETDKYMIIDFPITEEEREEYKAYRQYLRNYTLNENWYENEPLNFNDWHKNSY